MDVLLLGTSGSRPRHLEAYRDRSCYVLIFFGGNRFRKMSVFTSSRHLKYIRSNCEMVSNIDKYSTLRCKLGYDASVAKAKNCSRCECQSDTQMTDVTLYVLNRLPSAFLEKYMLLRPIAERASLNEEGSKSISSSSGVLRSNGSRKILCWMKARSGLCEHKSAAEQVDAV